MLNIMYLLLFSYYELIKNILIKYKCFRIFYFFIIYIYIICIPYIIASKATFVYKNDIVRFTKK